MKKIKKIIFTSTVAVYALPKLEQMKVERLILLMNMAELNLKRKKYFYIGTIKGKITYNRSSDCGFWRWKPRQCFNL